MPPSETFEVVPDPSLMWKTGRAGYSLSEMTAEFVDNSIDARMEGHKLRVAIEVSNEKLVVVDDAAGMTKQVLKDAMRLAKSTKKNALGQYGLGLKAASISLG